MNWRSIKEEGEPTDSSVSYLVTDGRDVFTTNIDTIKNYKTGVIKFDRWSGDENTYEDNDCCSGRSMFELEPTHWLPASEIKLP